ncbi:murein L,D-transpeptidase catalytic domain family protein [Pseudomonas sp. WJP1]|uniref:murein L,D-transpeptidase catalytic domain family protein n=1 Tax=unclassified Pseudomonas TaxID=196821 RepID=UPI00026FA8BC|nr:MULTISPECIES: murein L,D-transpeptidase catalytic domain family protein [unclassified Pseudomonas]EJN31544.1 Ykud domain-containing protein [Pseudomonas sp. GM78]WCM49809.1 murein L,D-transpeptidase catalytic domain family protein [Pseudomonas sp. WJP1]
MALLRFGSLTALLLTSAFLPSAYADSLEVALAKAAPNANAKVIALAVRATQCTRTQGAAPAQRLAVIDYSLPSTEQRLWVFDLKKRKLLFHELVAHGRNSGENMATQFSNQNESFATSLGLYRTQQSYVGQNGYSLRMEGLEPGFNDNAFDRAIVIHGAPYVSPVLARANGRIGRSLGCPAVRPAIAHRLIDSMKDGQLLFSYYPDQRWLKSSSYINCGSGTVASSDKVTSRQ